jgi:hypothetical protein
MAGYFQFRLLMLWVMKKATQRIGSVVGGTRERRFDGTNFKTNELPKNAQPPTSLPLMLACPNVLAGPRVQQFAPHTKCDGVHALLGAAIRAHSKNQVSFLLQRQPLQPMRHVLHHE